MLRIQARRGLYRRLRLQLAELFHEGGGDTYSAYTITTHKIIKAGYHVRKDSGGVESMNLIDVIKIERDDPHENFVSVLGHGMGEMTFMFPSKQIHDRFVNALQRAVDQAKNKPKSPVDDTAATRLKELAKLHDQGLITKAEFDKKRNDILNRL